MATAKSQRIFIWVIAIVMTVGTLGAYFISIVSAENGDVKSSQELEYEKQYAEYLKQQEEAQKQRVANSKPLQGYSAASFDASAITELKTEDLVVGTGKDVAANSTIEANYFGWTSDGKIFDSTNQNGTVTPATFSLEQVIEGWKTGLTGAKEGSVRKLMIPTNLAYGPDAAQQGRPAGPLFFIVEVKSVK